MHEGRLAIGGCDVLELAREFGTPAYIVAEDDLRARARDFLRAMADHHGERGAVAFASKAFPCTEVLRIFREEGLVGRRRLRRRAAPRAPRGLSSPKEIVFHGNAKSEAELATIAELGVMCVIDNLDEIDRLGRHAGARAAAGDAAGRARGGDGHPPRRRDRPRRPEVRAHARGGRARRSPGSARRRGPTCRGSTCTSAPSSSTSRPTARRSRRSPGSASSSTTTSAAGSPSPYTAEQRHALGRRVGRGGRRRRARAARRPREGARDRARPRARRQRRA